MVMQIGMEGDEAASAIIDFLSGLADGAFDVQSSQS